MKKSDNIESLATALYKVQSEMENVYKDKKGYGYNYADLASILDIVRPVLSKHKLSILQLCGNEEETGEKVSLETVLMHESGQWVSSIMKMPVEKGKGSLAQAYGSVISYARRYALAAMLGIAQTDNDASVEQNVSHNQERQSEALTRRRISELLTETQTEYQNISEWFKSMGKKTQHFNDLSVEDALIVLHNLEKKHAKMPHIGELYSG